MCRVVSQRFALLLTDPGESAEDQAAAGAGAGDDIGPPGAHRRRQARDDPRQEGAGAGEVGATAEIFPFSIFQHMAV